MRVAAVAVAALALAAGGGAARPPLDRAALALDVLPPGQAGTGAHLSDQIALYDGLTPLRGRVTNADLHRFYKPELLELPRSAAVRVERPRAGVEIRRDKWDVPQVYGRTRADVEFGAGWATAEDRGIDLQLLRGPARIAALDVPGLDAFTLALSGSAFVPSAQTEAFLAAQVALARGAGAHGRELIRDVDAYVAGINAYFKRQGGFVQPWTRDDVIAVGTLIGAVFGAGGGDETRRAELLSALEQRLGVQTGLTAWNDLRELNDPEAPVTVATPFPYGAAPTAGPAAGNVVVDAGSFVPWRSAGGATVQRQRRVLMSNALLVGAKRSASGHPIFVAGPQVGYFAPEILMELGLHGGGLDARGVAFPGLGFYLQIGRGIDYAWSATSASSDVVDQFAETLCGDDVHYLYKGACRAMETFDAGTLKAPGEADRELVFRTTVHGPVAGYATVAGRRVAISLDRSTRGRELLSALPFQALAANRVTSPQSFFAAMGRFELTFNWFYADSRHIAVYSSGRLPLRAGGVDPGLPTIGTGEFDWRGFLAPLQHPHVVDPQSGAIVNWNNKPAPRFSAADSNWSYGSVQRVQLLQAELAKQRMHTPASVVAAMNEAATQDLRWRLVPLLNDVLERTAAPDARDARMLALLGEWDGSRVDANGDGKVDDPAAAIMDAAWPRLADAVVGGVLGPLTAQLAALLGRDDAANPGGSSYGDGWYGYVDKDLRDVLGKPVTAPFSLKYCGGGDAAACSRALWAALDAAGNALQAAQGADPAGWRADATGERIQFTGFLPATMRWTNRPTFQQVLVFRSHR